MRLRIFTPTMFLQLGTQCMNLRLETGMVVKLKLRFTYRSCSKMLIDFSVSLTLSSLICIQVDPYIYIDLEYKGDPRCEVSASEN